MNTDLDVLSLDVFTKGEIFSSYGNSIMRYLKRGGVLVWGIVPTGFENFSKSNLAALANQLESIWAQLARKGIDYRAAGSAAIRWDRGEDSLQLFDCL